MQSEAYLSLMNFSQRLIIKIVTHMKICLIPSFQKITQGYPSLHAVPYSSIFLCLSSLKELRIACQGCQPNTLIHIQARFCKLEDKGNLVRHLVRVPGAFKWSQMLLQKVCEVILPKLYKLIEAWGHFYFVNLPLGEIY